MKKIFLLIILTAITTINTFSHDTIIFKRGSCLSSGLICAKGINFNYKSDTLMIFGTLDANCFVTNHAAVEKIRDTIFISTIDSFDSECGCGICIEIKILASQEDTIVMLDGVVYNTKSSLNSINESVNYSKLIKIFPNPVNEILNIEVPDRIRLSKIILIDLTGRLVYTFGTTIRTINLEKIESGSYFMVFNTEYNGKVIKRIIKE
jgi:hypothetical protein